MRYYHLLALVALVLLSFSGACGGGPKGYHLAPDLSRITPEQSPYVTTLGVSGLKPQLHFTYSLQGHPSAGGFTVVALENEYTPKAPNDAPYGVAVTPDDRTGEPVVRLSVSGQRSVLAHLRYDPAKWEVGGVSSSNCWPLIRSLRKSRRSCAD
jgi:hypothetical protein